MKIWKAFGSAHSARLTVVGEFMNAADAELMQQAVEDYVNAAWEQRYPDLGAFLKAWIDRLPGVEILGPTVFELGIDNGMDVERRETRVTVSKIRSNVIGEIIQLMLMKEPTEVVVALRTLGHRRAEVLPAPPAGHGRDRRPRRSPAAAGRSNSNTVNSKTTSASIISKGARTRAGRTTSC